ncbi:DUF6731 family protein [Vallitalea guaymasensis]|uniref:DUF6731 family protein n=1 Tax=Vallitalea guaymasensis TaxID=1185412 RepID=UPI000DE3EB75|nr:DUF6731 family protein [Vallitalea guaymasensis]
MKKKKIFFDYFEVRILKSRKGKQPEEKAFDITKLLEKAKKLIDDGQAKKTVRPTMGDSARFHEINYDRSNKIWDIQLLRLRDALLPGIADEEGEFEVIKLDSDKYVGESLSILYDKENCILMMQRNNLSISPGGIEVYLNNLYIRKDSIISLRPIKISDNKINKINKNANYRSINFGVAVNTGIKSRTLRNMFKTFDGIAATTFKGEISMGRKRKKTLDPGISSCFIKELYDEKDISELKVNMSYGEEPKFEKVDLLDDRRRDNDTFEYDRINVITHKRVIKVMRKKYLYRKVTNTIY